MEKTLRRRSNDWFNITLILYRSISF